MSTSPLPAAPGSEITVTVQAQSSQNLTLTYSWELASVDWTITGDEDAATVTVEAPALAEGSQGDSTTATVTVTDSEGRQAVGTVVLFTRAEVPIFQSLTFSTPISYATQILASVTDPQNSELSYAWTIGGVEPVPAPPSEEPDWSWTPPGLPGLYLLVAEATNAYGLRAQASAFLTVDGAHPWAGFARDLQRTGRSPVDTSGNVGEILWSTPENGDDSLPGTLVNSSPAVAADGTIYIGSSTPGSSGQAFLTAVSPNGGKKWSTGDGGDIVHLPGNWLNSSPTVAADSTVYIGSYLRPSTTDTEAYLTALNPDGSRKWSTPNSGDDALPGTTVSSSPAVGADGTVYIGSHGGGAAYLTAVNPDGTRKWSTEDEEIVNLPGASVSSSPAVAADGTIYIGSSTPGSSGQAFLTAVSPNGGKKWSTGDGGDIVHLPGNFLNSSPAVGADGTVYIGSYGGGAVYLTAVNADGTKRWSTDDLDPLPGNFLNFSPAVAIDGTVYIGSYHAGAGTNPAYLTAVNPDGTRKWSTEDVGIDDLPGNAVSSSPAVAAEGTIYVGGHGGSVAYLTAVNPGGSRKWSTPNSVDDALPGNVVISSPAVGADGTVYIGSHGPGTTGQAYLSAVK